MVFGNKFGNETECNKDLRVMLESEFNGMNGRVGLNDYWQKNQEWPTLAMAKETNQRVFAIVRTKTKEKAEIFFGSKILPEKEYKLDEPVLDLGLGKFINVLTGYKKVSIGTNCSNIVKIMGETCKDHPNALTNILRRPIDTRVKDILIYDTSTEEDAEIDI